MKSVHGSGAAQRERWRIAIVMRQGDRADWLIMGDLTRRAWRRERLRLHNNAVKLRSAHYRKKRNFTRSFKT